MMGLNLLNVIFVIKDFRKLEICRLIDGRTPVKNLLNAVFVIRNFDIMKHLNATNHYIRMKSHSSASFVKYVLVTMLIYEDMNEVFINDQN